MATSREQEPTDGLIYVNWARTLATPYDFSLDLGFRSEPAAPSSFPIRAVMSWEEAKVLALLIQDAVDHYEKEVGPIRDLGGEVIDAEEEEADDQEEGS